MVMTNVPPNTGARLYVPIPALHPIHRVIARESGQSGIRHLGGNSRAVPHESAMVDGFPAFAGNDTAEMDWPLKRQHKVR
jgi:hypothetical protein